MTPTLMLLLVFFAAYKSLRGNAVHWFMLLNLFGGQAALLLTALGGANVSPAVCMLPILVWAAMRHAAPNRPLASLGNAQATFWLALVVLCGCLTAYFMPRLLQGSVVVFTTDRSLDSLSVLRSYLKPVSTNITQSLYAVGSLLAFWASSVLINKPGGQLSFRRAALNLATWNIGAAFLNLIEMYAHIPTPLSLLRGLSGYTVIEGAAIGNLGRITGLFPESSMFAIFTLGLFAYCFWLWRSGIEETRTGWLALISFALLIFSTSSTAYAGLIVYFSLVGTGAFLKSFLAWKSEKFGSLTGLFWAALVGICLAALLNTEWVETIYQYFEVTVLRKLDSDSGMERGSWNSAAWSNFLESYGFGLGLGSTRASSYPLLLLSNIGVVGTTFYFCFLARLTIDAWWSEGSKIEQADARASWHAVIGIFAGACFSATVFDLGLSFYCFAAAACTLGANRQAILGASKKSEKLLHG